MFYDPSTPPPTADTPQPGSFQHQPRKRRVSRAVLTLALAGGLAAGGVDIANAASGTPTPPAANSTTAAATPNHPAASGKHRGPAGLDKHGGPAGLGKHGGPAGLGKHGGAAGPGMHRGPAALRNSASYADGRISAVNATTLKVTSTTSGTVRDYTLGSATTIHRGPGQKLSPSALRVGDQVHVRGQASTTGGSSTGSLAAVNVDVHLAHIDGLVTGHR